MEVFTMFNHIKSNILFNKLFSRPNIENAYKMVAPTDSWYDTITTVHNSLARIKEYNHKTVMITSHDGLKLSGIYYPNNSDVTVISVHGYTSHAEREFAFPGLFYKSLGYNVLIPYQRAHGLSEGKYLTFGPLEHMDMLKWIDYVNEINPNGQIILHGLSMGGGILLHLCNKEAKNVKCMVVDAPSGSANDFLKNVSNEVFKKSGPKVYKNILKKYQRTFNVNLEEYDLMKFVTENKYPTLLSAGEMEGRSQQFNYLTSISPSPIDNIILPGCNHGNGMYKQTELYQSKIKEFINKYIE